MSIQTHLPVYWSDPKNTNHISQLTKTHVLVMCLSVGPPNLLRAHVKNRLLAAKPVTICRAQNRAQQIVHGYKNWHYSIFYVSMYQDPAFECIFAPPRPSGVMI